MSKNRQTISTEDAFPLTVTPESNGLNAPAEPPKRTRRQEDPEIKAMREIDLMLTDSSIPPAGVGRILTWMVSRYGPSVASQVDGFLESMRKANGA